MEGDRDRMKTGIKYPLNIRELESIFGVRFKINISYFLTYDFLVKGDYRIIIFKYRIKTIF